MENRRAPGFKNNWQRSMKKALRLTSLGSDVDTDVEAQEQLGHSDTKTTRKHYRRRGSVVKAAKGFFQGDGNG